MITFSLLVRFLSTFLEREKKLGYMAIKHDVEKTYNRLEWDFKKKCFQDLGLSNQWVNWKWQCISILTLRVIVNDRKGTNCVPGIGTRQGDSLSLYFYYLCRILEDTSTLWLTNLSTGSV